MTRDEAGRVLRGVDAVCFDVDSTVITVEGIDEYAGFLGVGDKVAELTASAMGGSMPFHEALDARLSAMQPTAASLDAFMREHELPLAPGIEDVFRRFRERNADVFLVSGGFTQMIAPLAGRLGVPRESIYANTILFGEDGAYAGFDTTAPTSRAGGKAEVVRRLLASGGYVSVAMVGDGATDMEARPPADVFVGFGGVAVRPDVRRGADLWATDFGQVLDLLKGD